jgi:hypothetical protein
MIFLKCKIYYFNNAKMLELLRKVMLKCVTLQVSRRIFH